ncbi:MAG: amidohydrolase [Candidatus Sumerlaeia bacterium]|nr:amidohydrolase [Candidatus Sumerlaeia bacterium]
MILFRHPCIRTLDPTQPVVDGLLVQGDTVLEVAPYAQLRDQVDSSVPEVQLPGECVLPGFNDAHVHTWKVGQLRTTILDLRGVQTKEELFERLRQFAVLRPHGTWLLARGYNEALFSKAEHPNRLELDRCVPDHPVWVMRTCAHMGVANTKALRLAGISSAMVPPVGGHIVLDSKGELTGLLQETAMGLIQRMIPAPTLSEYESWIRSGQQAQLEYGITSATDPAVHPELLEAYRNLEGRGELLNRHALLAIRRPDGGTIDYPIPVPSNSRWLRVDGVKAFADGGLSGATAALSVFYRHSNTKGILRFNEDTLYRLLLPAHREGFRIGIHAIGDAAIEQVLTVYERLYRESRGVAHRIEHFGLPTQQHLQRAARMGLNLIPQAIFIRELGKNFHAYLPKNWWERPYPIRSMVESGCNTALSSDAPVVFDFNPLQGMQTACTRLDASGNLHTESEALSISQAVQAYTVAGAMASGDGDNRGVLSKGKLADFVALSADPYNIPASELSSVTVLQTWVGGECRYQSAMQKNSSGEQT